ncbi:MAG TPA: hypothetical protein VEV82_00825 [Actinomycetota bacterium]|nr:hypothetical protein [Actinomycetota bacterium]
MTHPAHQATDLTADHVVPVKAGGSEDGVLMIQMPLLQCEEGR